MNEQPQPSEAHPLDNPIWHALIGPHANFAIGGAAAKRYPADVAMFAGFPDGPEPNLAELARLMTRGEFVLIRDVRLPIESGFICVHPSTVDQYVYEAKTINVTGSQDIIELQEADVPDILRLVDLTQPGPFLPGTFQMGHYFGIRSAGKLIAMAGERMHVDRFREISAVCTDPAHAGRGYATQLIAVLIDQILKRNEIPFLHVSSDNDRAIRLYQKLGFTWRMNSPIQVVQFVR